jgi:rhodanese-related sulfurtransferase
MNPPPASLLPDPEQSIEVTPQTVAEWIHLPEDQRPILLDCREADEVAIAALPGHRWHALATLPGVAQHLAEAAERQGLVIYCHHGMRSLRAADWLRAHGISRAYSMAGGIDAWSRLIDPELPRY